MQTIQMLVWMLHKMHEPKPYSPDDTPGALGQQFDECTALYLDKVRFALETPEGVRIDAHAESIMRKKAAAERLLAEREPISDTSITTYSGETVTLFQLKQQLNEALDSCAAFKLMKCANCGGKFITRAGRCINCAHTTWKVEP